MNIRAHCFADNAEIDPPSFTFGFKGWTVRVVTHSRQSRKNLMLEISRTLTAEEVDSFKVKIGQNESQPSGISTLRRSYSEILAETAHLIEGIMAIYFDGVPPKFTTNKPIVNLLAQIESEQELLNSEAIIRGFGHMDMANQTTSFKLEEYLKTAINPASNHLPALSFFAQAIRSKNDNEQEVAFFLFFRILDGYFSNGKKDVESALLERENDIAKVLPFSNDIKMTVSAILEELNVPSKCHENYRGLLSDIVKIRHKLTHFSATRSKAHHSVKINFDLRKLNYFLCNACRYVLWSRIDDGQIAKAQTTE